MAEEDNESISQNRLSTFLQKYTDTLQEKNGLDIRKFIFHTKFEDPNNKIRRVVVGEGDNIKPSKAIILVGSTGAGKSSLISSLVNKYYGIKFEDNYRIKVFDKESVNKKTSVSQTEWITAYQFGHIEPDVRMDYNLTIIDTPGLNDNKGLKYDQLLFQRLELILNEDQFGVDEIHCVGIVTESSANVLTDAQMYVYDGCMRIFGENVKENIHIMITFSDQSEPNIIQGLEDAGVEYMEIHQFNNSSIYLSNDPQHKFARMNICSWEFMDSSSGDFLNTLQETDGKSLTKTKDTLKSRRLLHKQLKELNEKFLENLSEAKKSLAQSFAKTHNLQSGNEKAFNCNKCKVTCHFPCYTNWIFNCKNCEELSKKGSICNICECLLELHKREDFKYDYEHLFEDKRKDKIKEVIKSLDEINKVIQNLKEVALRPIPMSFDEYIKTLIDREGSKNDESTTDKLVILKSIKEQEERMHNILNNHNDKEIEELIHQIERSLEMEQGETEWKGCVIM